MSDESAEEVIGKAIANATAAVSAPIVAISRLLVKKGRISADELKVKVQKGDYATLETCNDDIVDQWDLGRAFNHRADVGDCYVFWEVNREAHFERDKKPKAKS